MIIVKNVAYFLILIGIKHGTAIFSTNSSPEYSHMSEKINTKFPKYIPNGSDVETCIFNNWWDLARKIVMISHEQDIDLSSSVHSAIELIQKNSKELMNLLSKQYNELDVVNAALQWAESPHEVFLSIKFSARWSSPGALQVEDEVLNVENDRLEYSGIGTHSGKRKKYQVNLHLFNKVVGPETKVTSVSMGRFSITLKKEKPQVWNSLNKSQEKVPNQQIWWEMKEKYQAECDKFVKESKKKEL